MNSHKMNLSLSPSYGISWWLLLVIAAPFANTGYAETNIWSGGHCAVVVDMNCVWGDAQNWVEQGAPANNGSADIVFGVSLASTPNMDSSWNVRTVTFDVTASAYICAGGGNTLTLQA